MATPEKLALSLSDGTPDYIFVMEEEGRLLFANPAFVQAVLGGESLAGQNLFSLVDAASGERARRTVISLAGGPQQVELYHVGQDGRLFGVLYSLCRAEGGVAGIGRNKTPDLELLGEVVQLNQELEEKQVELAEANARLEQMATTDHLTGLYNRHYFSSVVQHLYDEARRYKLPLCVTMMDVDHFKSVNDGFGHVFGDHVLKVTAERLVAGTRRSDLLARYGGEEFVLVTPNTDLRIALMLADRLRQAIEHDPYVLGSTTLTVTASLGISGTELVATGPFRELLESADQALYQAKRSGRNRCCVYKPSEDQAAAAGAESLLDKLVPGEHLT